MYKEERRSTLYTTFEHGKNKKFTEEIQLEKNKKKKTNRNVKTQGGVLHDYFCFRYFFGGKKKWSAPDEVLL